MRNPIPVLRKNADQYEPYGNRALWFNFLFEVQCRAGSATAKSGGFDHVETITATKVSSIL